MVFLVAVATCGPSDVLVHPANKRVLIERSFAFPSILHVISVCVYDGVDSATCHVGEGSFKINASDVCIFHSFYLFTVRFSIGRTQLG